MNPYNQKIFSVRSRMDIGIEILLDEEGYSHIVKGHPNLSQFVTGIKEVVESPTHVYTSSYDPRRLQFFSNNVRTGGGHLISVVVQIRPGEGLIVTASPKKNIKGAALWDESAGYVVSYDARFDVLYFSASASDESYADEAADDDRIWMRFSERDDSPIGMTIFQAKHIWESSSDVLVDRISSFFSLVKDQVRQRIKASLAL